MAMGFRPGLFGRPKMGGMMGAQPGLVPSPFDVPNAPAEQPKKQGLFGGDMKINPKLAALSQIFSSLGGQESPVFSLALMQQQQQRAADQAEAARRAGWEDFQRQFDYKKANETPRVNDTVEDFNWYKNLSDEDRAMYHKMRPVYRQGPDGQFYAVDTGTAPSAGPAAPVGKLTPIGGQPGGAGPFSYDTFKRAIIGQESGGRYGVANIQGSGAMGLGQQMPDTARVLSARLGLPYRPDLLSGTSKEAQAYQNALTDAAAKEAWEYGQRNGGPGMAARYYFAGPDRKGWGPKTRKYERDVLARMGVR